MKNITDLSQYEGKAIMLTNQESQVSNKFYRSQVVVIDINMSMFHSMGQGNFMPAKGLTNNIAHGAGIEFTNSIRMNDTFGDVVIHTDGTKTRSPTGKECFKQGLKMKPDGTWAPSSVCSYEYNFVDRAEDEMGEKYEKMSIVQRKAVTRRHKKFSSQRASTGVSLAVIRELLGVDTSFKKEQIALGKIVVSRIEKTEDFQEALAHAEVENVRNGGLIADRINNTTMQLTGETIDSSEDFNNHFERTEAGKQSAHSDHSGNSEPSGNTEPKKQPAKTDQGFKTEKPDVSKTPIKPETSKEEYERFCTENNIQDNWKSQVLPTLTEQKYSKESVDWAIGEMQARL